MGEEERKERERGKAREEGRRERTPKEGNVMGMEKELAGKRKGCEKEGGKGENKHRIGEG